MSNEDRVRLIAERVARRVGTGHTGASKPENGFDRREADPGDRQPLEPARARVIDFVASGPPIRTKSRVSQTTSEPMLDRSQELRAPESILTASPWHGRLPAMLGHNPHAGVPPANHPSEERFGIEEATVTELVEFFEKEKQCAMDPSGKPCDHCAMCSGRGF